MAISFDTANCKDFQKHFPDQTQDGETIWNPLFYSLTMAMLVIGGPTKNMEEFWYRVDAYQHLLGALAQRFIDDGSEHGKREPVYLTKEQVMGLEGLRINIAPLTDKQFDKKLAEIIRNEYKRGWLSWQNS